MAALARPAASGTRIAGAAAILLGGFVASRMSGLLRDVVISARFGTSADYDLYVVAFNLPDTIFMLIAGGALGSALVPVFAEYRADRGGKALERLTSAVFNLVVMAAGLAALLGIALAPPLVPLLGAGFSPAQQARLAALVRIMLLQPVFLGASEVVSRYLNVHRHFVYPALAPTLYNLAITAAALALGPSLGTLGLAIGVTVGALAYLFVQLPAASALGFRWRPGLDVHEAGLRRIGRLMLPRLIGQGAVQLSLIVSARLASFLPTGSVAALKYGWLLMMLPLGTFAMSLANAAFPTLSEQAARGEQTALTATIRRTLGAILFVMVPSAVGLIIAGQPLVETVFQRGAFTARSSALTAAALAMYAVGLPAHGAIEILTRSFYARQNTRTPVAVGVAAMAGNIVLAYGLVGSLGHLGIALAASLSATAEAAMLVLLLGRQLPGLLAGDLLWSAGRTCLAGAALAAAALPTVVGARYAGAPPPAQMLAAAALGAAAYVGTAFAVRSPDLEAMVHLLRRRLER